MVKWLSDCQQRCGSLFLANYLIAHKKCFCVVVFDFMAVGGGGGIELKKNIEERLADAFS